jgi:putative endonuclease
MTPNGNAKSRGSAKNGGTQKGERQRRNRSGVWGETLAAAFLMAKGYRVLERRFSCAPGEIDLIAARGRRLAFIEVKKRATLDAAHASISDQQRLRIRNAAVTWLARHSRYQTHDISFDVIFILPRRWPQHLENAL